MLRQFVRFLCWSTLQILFRLEVKGGHNIPAKGGGVVVGNHVSYADAFLIGSATPRFIRWILWKSLHDIKFLTPIFELLRTVPIDLSRPRDAVATLAFCRAEVEAGELAGIFPEGQITRTGHLQPFKRGYERVAESKSGVQSPIIPTWIEGLWGHPLSMKGGRLAGSWERWRRPRVTVLIGEPVAGPIPPEALRAKVMELASQAATDKREPHDTLGQRFVAAARARWNSLAIADSAGNELTFGQTLAAAQLLRRWLDRHAAGQPLAGVLQPNSSATAIANIAIALSGRAALNLDLEPPPGVFYLDETMPNFSALEKAIAYLQARFLPAGLLAKGHSGDVAAVTGSNGVELTHWNLISNVEAVAQVYPVGPSDAMLGTLPFSDPFGFAYNLWFPLLHGFPVIFPSDPGDAKATGALAQKYRATFLLATPAIAESYARNCAKEQFSTLRYALGVGGATPGFEDKFGLPLYESYGCAEMSPMISVNGPGYVSDDPDQASQLGCKAESAGRPLPGISVRFVDPVTLAPVPYGQAGLLLVKGPSLMRGYRNQPERTQAALIGGYYNTGEIARLDEEGFLFRNGRR